MHQTRPNLGDQSGNMLIGMLIAIGIMGILAVVSMQLFSNSMQAHKIVERKGEFEDLRRLVRISMSCSKTLAGKACSSQDIALLRRDGSVVGAAADGTNSKIGAYTLDTTCSKQTSGETRIDVAVIDAKGKREALFKDVPFVCPVP